MAEVVAISEMVSEPEIVTEDVSVVAEEVSAENVVDIEEIAAEMYYYQSEQEVLASSMKSITPPKIFESFAGYFEEPKTGSCQRFEDKKKVVEELIDVSKELTGEALKDIADKALMGKLREVDSELEKSESVSTVSVKKESDKKSGVQEIKSVKMSESELNNVGKIDCVEQVVEKVVSIPEIPCQQCLEPCMECLEKVTKYKKLKHHADMLKFDLGQVKEAYDTLARSMKMIQKENGVEAALNLKLRSIEDDLPESIDVTFSASDTDNESQVIKTVVNQVLDEESDKSEESQSEKASFVTSRPTSSGKKEGDGKGSNKKNNVKNKGIGFEKKTAKQVFKLKEKMNDIFVAGPSVDDEKDYIFSQKVVDDFNAAKKLKEETVKSTFVEYDKRVCYRCSEIGHMAKQCKKVIEKPVFVKPRVQKQTVQKPTVQKSNVPKPRPKSPIDTKGKKPMGLPKSIPSKWIMDSGASRHMTGTLALLYDVKSINGSYVGFAGNQGGRIGSSVIFDPLHSSCCDLDVKKNTELAKFSSILEFMGRIPIQKALTDQRPLYRSHIECFWENASYDDENKEISSIVEVHGENKKIIVT
ncbi:uncharacterized protein LOC110893269 [Helianthus annuus]|uniref:uncharacterized protein LOC110893269 n=1 Tax=Helianthus annuus TaxID=4232 RepID=UPI000B90669A|nr:uncharacterized protein LOC110893269 [Helianthus annuus]